MKGGTFMKYNVILINHNGFILDTGNFNNLIKAKKWAVGRGKFGERYWVNIAKDNIDFLEYKSKK